MKVTVKLPFKKETKNMVQYQAEDKEDVPIPTLYVSKEVVSNRENGWPSWATVTVEFGE